MDELNIERVDVQDDLEIPCNSLLSQSADMLDKTKKTMFYGKEYNVDTVLAGQITKYKILCISLLFCERS